ncbi:DUF3173 family protein [Gemella cuniculi]|uniref:DUF3173 family protein n=1 Tax=Gemella cuniculi TaxID=150240 RepID=UPI00040EDDB4|nr:DUF3173 family protein [Gemella cuniculi]
MLTMTRQDLQNLGYGVSQSSDIIRKAKRYMVNQGYGYYDNRRLGRVPVKIVGKILGIDNLTIQLKEYHAKNI